MRVHLRRAGEEPIERIRRRWPARSAGRPPTTANSGRRPSPTSAGCVRPESRTPTRRASTFALIGVQARVVAQPCRRIAPLSSVSCVPKLLEISIAAVRAGSSPASMRCAAAPSTLERKCTRKRPAPTPDSASTARRGPRSEPPMPTLTMSVTSAARQRGDQFAHAQCARPRAWTCASRATGACERLPRKRGVQRGARFGRIDRFAVEQRAQAAHAVDVAPAERTGRRAPARS